MTEKQFAKYAGKLIRVTRHRFPHSVALDIWEGYLVLDRYKVMSYKTTPPKELTKTNFRIILQDEPNAYHIIKWNELKLILKVEEIE